MEGDRLRFPAPARLPALYAILDAEVAANRGVELQDLAGELVSAGVTLLQYRDKHSNTEQILRNADALRIMLTGSGCLLILNDRPELALRAGWDGVHVGQDDSPPAAARGMLGPGRLIGLSTHTEMQVRDADAGCADYLAIGPVFTTGTKRNADAVVGLEGVRLARRLTSKPLVAIGGINLENAAAVIEAGADSVAVISGFFAGTSVAGTTRSLLASLRRR